MAGFSIARTSKAGQAIEIDPAKLDEGTMWPVAYALMELTATEEKKIAALVKKAAS